MISSMPADFLDLAERKLDWIDARAGVLAGNVANADTPGYRPRDLASFSSFLSRPALSLVRTNDADLPEKPSAGFDDATVEGPETAPDGNSISIDQQMRLIASNDQDQSVVTTLYKKYLGMTDLALGVSG